MITLEEYILNPCELISIPYYKNKYIELPQNMKIVHHNNFNDSYLIDYEDEQYFRLYHSLKNINTIAIDNNYYIKTAQKEDIHQIVSLINKSYADLSVDYEQILSFTKTDVYDKDLWIIVYDRKKEIIVGGGIADYDKEAGEGILEWIQVLPDYRGKKIGQVIVNEILNRLVEKASFVTVSGKINNETNPERLYRKCGFSGNDIWHILFAKRELHL